MTFWNPRSLLAAASTSEPISIGTRIGRILKQKSKTACLIWSAAKNVTGERPVQSLTCLRSSGRCQCQSHTKSNSENKRTNATAKPSKLPIRSKKKPGSGWQTIGSSLPNKPKDSASGSKARYRRRLWQAWSQANTNIRPDFDWNKPGAR